MECSLIHESLDICRSCVLKPSTSKENKNSKKEDTEKAKGLVNQDLVQQLSQKFFSLIESSIVSIPASHSTRNEILDDQESDSENENADDGSKEGNSDNVRRTEVRPLLWNFEPSRSINNEM